MNCMHCETELTATNWPPSLAKKDYRCCGPCRNRMAWDAYKKRREKNPEKILAQRRESRRRWVAKNKEKYLAQARKNNARWRKKNPDKLIAAVNDWKRRHPEKVREYSRQARERNKAKRAAYLAAMLEQANAAAMANGVVQP